MDWSIASMLGTMFFTTMSTVSILTWWLSKQFSGVRHLIHERVEEAQLDIVSKLQYHERHDDQRFASLTNDLWTIKLRNAAIDAKRGVVLIEKENEN